MDLKELKAIIKLCRSEGVTAIKMGDLELAIKPKEKLRRYRSPVEEQASLLDRAMTDEEIMFWSTQQPGSNQ
jgi:hypothetical protein